MNKPLALLIALLASGSPALAQSVSVKDFGAKCDGVTDDTLALQAAILAADTAPYRTLTLPPSVCVFSDTLTFGNRTDRYSEVSVAGHSEYTSTLKYAGLMDRPAIRISHMSAFRWSGFGLASTSYANFATHGTSAGIQLDGPTGSGGTMNTNITFDHLMVSGFHLGMLAGNGPAASEIECRLCVFSWNDVGWTSSGYNALNFWFYGLGIHHNQIGVKLGGPWVSDGPHVVGGSSAQNSVADFFMGNSFGSLSIDSFRAEVTSPGAKFMTGQTSGAYPPLISLRGSTIIGTPTQTVIDVSYLHVTTSQITGRMVAWPDSCASYAGHHVVTIEDSAVTPDPVTGWPVTFPANGGLYKFRFSSNRPSNYGTTIYLEDKSGTWVCGAVQ